MAIALTLGMSAAGAFAVGSTDTGWAPIGPRGDGLEIGISCLAASDCIVSGLDFPSSGDEFYGLMHVVGGRVVGGSVLSASGAIACRPHWCVAEVDEETHMSATTWNGRRWSRPVQVGPTVPGAADGSSSVDFESLSCPALGTCYGVVDVVETKTTKGCERDAATAGCSTETDSIYELHAGTWQLLSGAPTFVGDARPRSSSARAVHVRGMSVSGTVSNTATVSGGGVGSISCAAVGHCVLLDSSEVRAHTRLLAEVLDGGRWTTEVIGTLRRGVGGRLDAISCWSLGHCAATGVAGQSAEVNRPLVAIDQGGHWELQRLAVTGVKRGAALTAVSCNRLGRCLAVGGAGVADDYAMPLSFSWRGGHWEQLQTPTPFRSQSEHADAFLFGVSCPTIHSCTAVGDGDGWYLDNYRM